MPGWHLPVAPGRAGRLQRRHNLRWPAFFTGIGNKSDSGASMPMQPLVGRARGMLCMSVRGIVLVAIGIAAAPGVRAQDVSAGWQVFQSQCSVCHSPRPGRNIVGPSLFGVVGRHSGTVPAFRYSQANRRSGLTWTPSTLDRYLTAPQRVVPGTLMTYPGLRDPKQRADLIAYLATLR